MLSVRFDVLEADQNELFCTRQRGELLVRHAALLFSFRQVS